MTTIKKRDLGRYLRNTILPQFPLGWKQYGDHAIIRINGTIMQMVYFERSELSPVFVPAYCTVTLSITDDYIPVALGARITKKKGILSRPREFWIDWPPENKVTPQEIYQLLLEQVRPKIDEPLTLEAVSKFMEKLPMAKGDWFVFHWPMGIVRGLQGRLDDAVRHFELAEKDIKQRASGWERKGESVPEDITSDLAALAEIKMSAKSLDTFTAFCEAQTAKTIAALKLPGSKE